MKSQPMKFVKICSFCFLILLSSHSLVMAKSISVNSTSYEGRYYGHPQTLINIPLPPAAVAITIKHEGDYSLVTLYNEFGDIVDKKDINRGEEIFWDLDPGDQITIQDYADGSGPTSAPAYGSYEIIGTCADWDTH